MSGIKPGSVQPPDALQRVDTPTEAPTTVRDDERAKFETWFKDYLGPLTTTPEKNFAWTVWQARAALSTPTVPAAEAPSQKAIQLRQADERGDEALQRAHKLEEALEYLFLAIVTRADTDYLFRAVNRADEALRMSMPGWTPPVPMVGWQVPAAEAPKPSEPSQTRAASAEVPRLRVEEIIDAFQNFGTGRLDGFAAAVRSLEKRLVATPSPSSGA